MDRVRATRERTSAVSSSSGMGAPVRGLRDGLEEGGADVHCFAEDPDWC